MGKYYIYYFEDGEWIFLEQLEDTENNVLDYVSSLPKGRKYQIERITHIGNQIINSNN